MPFQLVPLPIISEDAARSVKYSYGNGNLYIQLGDQLNQLLSSLAPARLEKQDRKLAETQTRSALITAVQYAEELTDYQALEAVRSRDNLKYALHLSPDYPSLDPRALCKFRQQLYHDPSDIATFQVLLNKLREFGLINPKHGETLRADDTLRAICTSTRIEKLMESMECALETLAVYHGDWLRKVALPLWYERYSRRSKMRYWPNGKGEWKTRTLEIGTDMQYLLKEVEKAHQPEIEFRREVRNLSHILDEQFVITSDEVSQAQQIHWREAGCASCRCIH
jgi:transposase